MRRLRRNNYKGRGNPGECNIPKQRKYSRKEEMIPMVNAADTSGQMSKSRDL